MALTTQINFSIIASLTNPADFGTTTFPLTYNKGFMLASGVGLNQADMIWSDQRTLGSGANEDIDLAGSLTSHISGTLTLARVKGLWIYASSANTVNLTVSRPASLGAALFSAAGDALVLKPGGAFFWLDPSAAGVTITGGSTDLVVNILAGAASSVYDIVVIGGLS
jgi:hypothetical protein